MTAGLELLERGAEDGELALLKLFEIGEGQVPLDFGIPRQRAGSGAGDIGENAVKRLGRRKVAGVGHQGFDASVLRAETTLHQARAMGMDLDGGDGCVGILVGDGEGFASGSGAAIEDADSPVRGRSERRPIGRPHPG